MVVVVVVRVDLWTVFGECGRLFALGAVAHAKSFAAFVSESVSDGSQAPLSKSTPHMHIELLV